MPAAKGRHRFASYLAERLSFSIPDALRLAAGLTSLKMERPGSFHGTRHNVENFISSFAECRTRAKAAVLYDEPVGSDSDELLARLRVVFEGVFTGWDFSSPLADWVEPTLPWDYEHLVKEHLPEATRLLDMHTGGGEFLSSLAGLPETVWATEAYAPNVPLARQRLEPLGYHLQPLVDPLELPFADGSFDMIINGRGAFDWAEVERCLCPGGVFITEQVGGLNAVDLNQALGAPLMADTAWCLYEALARMWSTHLAVSAAAQDMGTYRFHSVDAIVFYLRAIPWQVPGFSPDAYINRLAMLDQLIEREGHFDVVSQRFMIIAYKPFSQGHRDRR